MNIKPAVSFTSPNTAPVDKVSVYPKDITSHDVSNKINDLQSRRFLSGPNCWGTTSFLLGITSTFRYVSEIEFNDFIKQANTISLEKGQDAPNGSVVCVWNNSNGSVVQNHVALVCDGSQGKVFEKEGPDEKEKFNSKNINDILTDAGDNSLFPIVTMVDDFNQPSPGKYVTLLDFSSVAKATSSDFEKNLSAYHSAGEHLNEGKLKALLSDYNQEIKQINNPRELSLAEGVFHLLDAIKQETHRIQQEFKAGDRTLVRKLAQYTNVSTFLIGAKDNIADQIHKYRNSLEPSKSPTSLPLMPSGENSQLKIIQK